MQPRKYVILRGEMPHSGKRNTLGPMAKALGSDDVMPTKIDFDQLTFEQAREVRKERGVQVAAPAMPLKLVSPVSKTVAIGGNDAWGIHAVNADTSTYDGEGVSIAVLDTGIDKDHPAFKDVEIKFKNFTKSDDHDTDGHGTHCTGTILGRDVEGCRIGIARGVKTVIIGKVFGRGGGGSDVLMEAVQWAYQQGANVISMSLGIDFPGYVEELVKDGMAIPAATSLALKDYRQNVELFEKLSSLQEATAAFRHPCIIVAASGNESNLPDYQIDAGPPAVSPGIISVAAVGPANDGLQIAYFSNTGARLAAPGVDIVSARTGGGLATMSGTSMATPHVAGVAALWAHKLIKAKQFTRQVFLDRITGSANFDGLNAAITVDEVGAGMVHAPQN